MVGVVFEVLAAVLPAEDVVDPAAAVRQGALPSFAQVLVRQAEAEMRESIDECFLDFLEVFLVAHNDHRPFSWYGILDAPCSSLCRNRSAPMDDLDGNVEDGGVYYGIKGIPQRRREGLAQDGQVERFAEGLLGLSEV